MVLLSAVLLVGACADSDTGDPAITTQADSAASPDSEDAVDVGTAAPSPVATSAPVETMPDGGDRSASITQLAIADLAERLGIEGADEIVVVIAEDVTWRNGSLGCPEPGMSYTQALVDGFRVILEVEGAQYPYHSGRGQAPFLCQGRLSPTEPTETPS